MWSGNKFNESSNVTELIFNTREIFSGKQIKIILQIKTCDCCIIVLQDQASFLNGERGQWTEL